MPPMSHMPPLSSRAAGKQPMNYISQPLNSHPPRTTTQSARAASKQPLSATNNPYNPSHHHPSPLSSDASGPQRNGRNTPINTQSTKNNTIWSTSSTEERERIKEFWLGLGEEERRNLVKVEKDMVLKKMRDQQRHACHCVTCSKKMSVPSPLILLPETFCLTEDPLSLNANHSFCPSDFWSTPLSLVTPLSPCSTALQRLPLASLSTIVTGMRLRTSLRYCTMHITRSWNNMRTISSGTFPLEIHFRCHLVLDLSLALSNWTRMAHSWTTISSSLRCLILI